ncbi:ribonuclease H-like domain-containing protein [Tanacetum coccineum]
MAEQDTPPLTITAMKIPIIKKGEYDIWSMRMRQYICHTYHNLWDIIINGDLQEELAPTGDQSGPSAPPVPKTTKQLAAKRNQEREAIKSRFGGNEESKKMQKNVLKHQFENITTIPNESLDKAYDRNKPDIDQTDIDDLYNNLKVYEDEMKRSSSSTSNSQNLAFLSSENTSRTNEVSTASGNFGVNTAGGTNSSSQSQVECYNCHMKGHFAKKCKSGWNQEKRSYGDNGKRNATSNEPSSQALVRSSDEELTPANDRFSKADEYHVVPPPITGNFLTLRADISFSVAMNSIVSTPNINKDKVIIEDWNSDDENDVSEVSPVKTNETQNTQGDKIGQTSKKAGIGFKKIKACFVCKSTDHLIKDYDFYDKKSPEPKLKNVVNTGQRVVKPVWDNAKRVNHQKISNKLNYPQARRNFVPSGVLTRTGLVNPFRPNEKRAVQTINTVRRVSTARSVSTARLFAPKTAQTSSAVRPIYPRMDNVRPRASSSQIKRSYNTKLVFRPKDLKQDVKTSRVKNMTTAGTRAVVNTGKGKMNNDLKKSRWVWRPKGNYMDHESKEKRSFILKKFEAIQRSVYRIMQWWIVVALAI